MWSGCHRWLNNVGYVRQNSNRIYGSRANRVEQQGVGSRQKTGCLKPSGLWLWRRWAFQPCTCIPWPPASRLGWGFETWQLCASLVHSKCSVDYRKHYLNLLHFKVNTLVFWEMPRESIESDTLWWTNILLWKITMFNGKIHYFYGPFSIAMLVHQRVQTSSFFDSAVPMEVGVKVFQFEARGLSLYLHARPTGAFEPDNEARRFSISGSYHDEWILVILVKYIYII